MPLPSTEVNQSIFRGFSDPNMSDEETGDEEGWEVAPGAFPRSARSNKMEEDHVFSDEPYDDGSPYYSLKVVREGSKEDTQTGASSPRQDDIMAVSVASSDTPAISNLADSSALKADATSMKTSKKKSPASAGAPIQQNMSLSSTGFYPYNIYQSLHKHDKKKDRDDSMLNDSRVTASTMSSRSSRKGDRDYSSSQTPPNVSLMEDQESASIMSDQQSSHVLDTSTSIQPPYSVVSARSRGTRGKARYLVRHTLATSQQVNANPATMLKNLFIGIEQERHMHKLTAENLRAVNNWFLFLPAILLSLLSGVVALVFEAELDTKADLTVYSSIFVGVAALISVFWQALAKQLDFGTRATLHDITAASLKRLSEDIPLTLASTDNIPAEYVALIGEKLAQATDSCPSTIPHKLEAAFAAVSDRMVLMLRPPMGQAPRKHVQKIDFMNMYSTAYDELTTEIIHYWAWPFALPQPRDASDAALENFKAIVIEGRERNNNKGGFLCGLFACCAGKKLARSLFDVVPAASVGDSSNYQNNNSKHQQSPASDYPIRSSMLGNEI